MPNVFTIFNHGTDFHRDKDLGELVTMVSNALRGDEARIEKTAEPTRENPLPYRLENANPSYLICEGPGSDSVDAENSSSKIAHSHPGSQNPVFNTGKPGLFWGESATNLNPALNDPRRRNFFGIKLGTAPTLQSSFMGNTAHNIKLTGQIYGKGWDDNVYKAVFLMTHLNMSEGMDIKKINLIGWSRGAVTCLKMAHKFFEVLPDVELNIFAVDPVPGGGDPTEMGHDTFQIPPNVTSYLAVYAMHDFRINFTPIDMDVLELLPRDRPRVASSAAVALVPPLPPPNLAFLPLPGNHSDVVQEKTDERGLKGLESLQSYRICIHLAWKFLAHHGSSFKHPIVGHIPLVDLAAADYLDYYNKMIQNLDTIALAKHEQQTAEWYNAKKKIVGGGLRVRDVCMKRSNYAPYPYMNLHHFICAQSRNAAALTPAQREADQIFQDPLRNLRNMGITY